MPCKGRLVLQRLGKTAVRSMALGINTDLFRENIYLFSYQAKTRENFPTSREQTLKLNEECNSQVRPQTDMLVTALCFRTPASNSKFVNRLDNLF
jgi:hypothetical protein